MPFIPNLAGPYRMRCSQGASGCGRRFTLRRHPDAYVKDISCPYCGCLTLQKVEKARRTEQKLRKQRGLECYCSAYPFPHSAGSLRFCDKHPLHGVEPSEDEFSEYEQVLETPRGRW